MKNPIDWYIIVFTIKQCLIPQISWLVERGKFLLVNQLDVDWPPSAVGGAWQNKQNNPCTSVGIVVSIRVKHMIQAYETDE